MYEKENKMTKREAIAKVIANDIDAEVIEFFQAELEKMDATNARRREKAAEKQSENQEFVDRAVSMLTNEPQTATDIKNLFIEEGVERTDGKEVNTQWVSALLRKAVAQEKATSEDVKITGKGTQKGYTVA